MFKFRNVCLRHFGSVVATACLLSALSCSTKNGEELAKTHCSSCHLYTSPPLLDKASWKAVLPEMAFRMGLVNYGLKTKNFDELTDALPTVPGQPMVTEEQFKLITDYFITNAPDSLAMPPVNPASELSQFEIQKVNLSNT